jgi:hypothetical protein
MKRKAKRIISVPAKSARKNGKITVVNDDGFGTSMPPPFLHIEIYFDQKGELESASLFFEEHESRAWKNQTGQPIRNWKVCAAEWIYNYRQEMKRRFRKSRFYSESF